MAQIGSICILGGGTAGWMAAAALSHKFKGLGVDLTLIESEKIGTVGVGEATLPHIRFFNDALGIDEVSFMKATKATYKLGIEFCDWGRVGDSYIHPFGDYGLPNLGLDFHQYWLRMKADGLDERLDAYSYPILASEQRRFQHPGSDNTKIGSNFGYAYQFDSGLYAKFLRQFSESNGVRRVEGKVVDVGLHPETGFVEGLTLDQGEAVHADLFVDCSGFRGVLIEEALDVGYEDWSKWLPCNSAFAVACDFDGDIPPYTRATARKSGWQWRIPLQHRMGNGHVFSSDFISDSDALDQLLTTLEGPPRTEPKRLSFLTGRRRKFWDKNVVAIGLSAGFLEPLESTSIHLIQDGITNLIDLLPTGNTALGDRQEYNARMGEGYDRVLDFLLLHYIANQRDDSEFWRYFQNLELPQSLQARLDAWQSRGYLANEAQGIFLPPSWIAVLIGQNILPHGYDPRADAMSQDKLVASFKSIFDQTKNAVAKTPNHSAYLAQIGAMTT